MSDELLTEVRDGIARMTFNRPHERNALGPTTIEDMNAFVREVEHRDDVRVILLSGTGEHFMAGGNVKSFAQMVKEMDAAERRRMFEERIHKMHIMFYTMARMRQPIVAAVRGGCAGVGLSFVLACDMAVASDTAFFTMGYIHIGTSPDGSSTYYLPRTVGRKKAMELALLGDRFPAADAERYGIINKVVPDAELDAQAEEIAQRLARGPAVAIGNTKRLLNASLQNGIEAQLQMEGEMFGICAGSEDWAEGVSAFAEKRKTRFKGR
ncbi:enoyl-CoA hydratase/isomerase family protein [Marinibaculum pumilum]|uniref:Enoyl-CoA hydratase/isomerase family protein n=1 Tax=Marinibaculum pumilum TaxID=1766165 RepID=A0ABV7L1C5_9PROT